MTEILVLEGGFNEEHKVSLTTAKEVKKIFKKNKINFRSLIVHPQTLENVIDKYSNKLICFNALHGTFGEDGKIQKILFDNRIKFSHSGVKASSIAFDKYLTKKTIEKTGINCPESIVFNKCEEKIIFKAHKEFDITYARVYAKKIEFVINNDFVKLSYSEAFDILKTSPNVFSMHIEECKF